MKSKITDSNSGLTLLRRSIQRYPDNPGQAKLEAFPNPYPLRDYWIHFECPEFTSLCPITGQPDFALITIDYIPDKLCLESKALKFYLLSYRNVGMFHEASVNRILEDIIKTCRPRRLKVNGKFNPRGGISIAVSAEYP
ncbi:MAG: preQ(1) synthase [Kiritimatiellia bacterium]|nr:preQ(1) synthase [Kiritimatiellia bacterium]